MISFTLPQVPFTYLIRTCASAETPQLSKTRPTGPEVRVWQGGRERGKVDTMASLTWIEGRDYI